MLTLVSFAAATVFALRSPPNKLLGWGPSLLIGTSSYIGLALSGFISYAIFGPNVLTSMLTEPKILVGICTLTGLIAFDTHVFID